MAIIDNTLLVMGIMLFFGLLVPELFKKFHLPFATSLLLLGMVFGPYGFDYVHVDESIELFGLLGASFLLLLIGLESKSHVLFHDHKKSIFIALVLGSLSFITAFLVLIAFGETPSVATLIGMIMIASSTSVMSHSLKVFEIAHDALAKIGFGSVMLQDIASIIMLSLLLSNGTGRFPILIYIGLVLASVVILRMFLPEIVIYLYSLPSVGDDNEFELRTLIALLLLIIFIYSFLGINTIIAAFLVGLSLADVIHSKALMHKLHTFGYGLFVPIFFFIVGMEADIVGIFSNIYRAIFAVVFIIVVMGTKFVSAYGAFRFFNFDPLKSLMFGSLSMARLTVTLCAVYLAKTLEILDTPLLTVLLLTVIVSTTLTSFLVHLLSKRVSAT